MAPPIAFGYGAPWTNDPSKLETQLEVLDVAQEYGIKVLDTARNYVRSPTFMVSHSNTRQGHGECEKFLGNQGLPSKFEIITKASMSLTPGGPTKDGILKDWKSSSDALKTEKVCTSQIDLLRNSHGKHR